MTERVSHHHEETRERLQLGKEIVVFMGPEGAGKSTIAKKIADEAGKPRVGIGDILRGIAADPEAKYHEECRTMFEESRYADPQLLSKIVGERFKQNDLADGFILDGGFRTIEEAEGFPTLLENTGRRMPVTAVYLHVPTAISIERLVTGPNARRRAGETEEGVHKRLDSHYDNLYRRMQVIENQEGWNVYYVDATKNIDQTTQHVHDILKNRKPTR